MTIDIRESQIEDALVGVGSLISDLLNLEDEPRLFDRQMRLPSGRLDLLYTHRKKLLLIELKVVGFNKQHLDQILGYKSDLCKFQQSGKLIKGDIEPHLLCTTITDAQQSSAKAKGVRLTEYDPKYVLEEFYKNFKPIIFFTESKPIVIGIWNLHLIHDFIYHLERVNSVEELQRIVKIAKKTLYNKIKFSAELKLVDWSPHHDNISLTELGKEYVQRKNENQPNNLSDRQAELLRLFVMKNPYISAVIIGVASVTESVFVLSKNFYPIPMNILIDYFPQYSGKFFDWKTRKAKLNGTKMYSNYAVDLGLLAKTQDTVYLTPAGFRFIIQMQMHKNLKMVEAIQ